MEGRILLAAFVIASVLAGCEGAASGPTEGSSADTPAVASPSSAAPVPSASTADASGSSSTGTSCAPGDQDPYVYRPRRLAVGAACLRVSGVIATVRQEADGDLHILLALDAAHRRYLTSANEGEELGDLVVEPVCVHPVTQADAVASCAADPDPLQDLPHTGMRVWMEGRYVLDSEHGGWAELHPLYRWGRLVGSTGTSAASGPAPLPVGAGSGLAVRITSVPSPGVIGADATLEGRSSAGATCSICVTLPSGNVSKVAALQRPVTAGSAGNVAWTWRIASSTRAGTAHALLSCALGSRSGSDTRAFALR